MRWLMASLFALGTGIAALAQTVEPSPRAETGAEISAGPPPAPGGLGLPPGALTPEPTAGSAPLILDLKAPEVNVRHPLDPHTGEPYRGYPITYPDGGRLISGAAPGLPSGAVLPVGYPQSPVYPEVNHGSHYQTGPCGLEECCERRASPWLENLSVFFGLNGFREPLDLGANANFGTRLALNWGLPLVEEWGVGLQVGVGHNYERSVLRILPFFTGVSDREQLFTTIGVFQRTSSGLNYGLAWDYRSDAYYEGVDTSQWRGLISLDLGTSDQAGFLATWRNWSDHGNVFGAPVSYRPINQVVFFWRHIWENDIVTKLWGGWAEEHSRFNPFLPPEPHARTPFVFGGEVFVPLSPKLALYGEANIITPNDTGVVSAMFGFAWFPGATTHNQARSRFAPLFPLANNTSFAVDVQP